MITKEIFLDLLGYDDWNESTEVAISVRRVVSLTLKLSPSLTY